MSLIPSESYSFPDHFTTTRAASRKPKNVEPEPAEPPLKKPAIVALPNPPPQPAPKPVAVGENPEPMRKVAPPAPNPALRRATASPPRVTEPPVRKIALPPTLKPKVRWNNRAPAMDPPPAAHNGNGAFPESLMPPAENVIQMKPQPPAPRPRVMPRPENLFPPKPTPIAPAPKPISAPPPPKPAAVIRPTQPVQPVPAPRARENPRPMAVSNPQADFFEAFAQGGESAISKRSHNAKMRRFVVCESIAVGALLPLAILGLSLRLDNFALHWIMNVLTIIAAVAAAVIPIVFFAATPTFPEIDQ